MATIEARDYKSAKRVAVPIGIAVNEIKVLGNTRSYKGKIKDDKERVLSLDGIGGALRSTDYKDPPKVALPVLTPDRAEKRQNGRRFKENGEEAFTLTAQDIHGVAIAVAGDDGNEEHPALYVQLENDVICYAVWHDGYNCYLAVRKLTPKECFRLQGWPDDYFEKAQFVNSDSQLYKQAGNGVTVNVIREIAERMK